MSVIVKQRIKKIIRMKPESYRANNKNNKTKPDSRMGLSFLASKVVAPVGRLQAVLGTCVATDS